MSAVIARLLPNAPAPALAPAGGDRAPPTFSFASILGRMRERETGASETQAPAAAAAPEPSAETSAAAPLSGLLEAVSMKSTTSARGSNPVTRKASLAEDPADPSSIEAALAALGYGAPAAVAKAGAPNPEPKSAAAEAPPSGAPLSPRASPPTPDATTWDVTGATPLKTLLGADPSLGLQTIQPKTHLAVAGVDATRERASGLEHRAGATPEAAPTAADPASSVGAAATDGKGASDHHPFAASRAPREAKPDDAVSPSPEVATATVTDVNLDPASRALGPVLPSQLPDLILDHANALTPPSAPSPTAPAPRAVKELEIALDPADLGAVSLKLRLANGKLSVVISVSSGTTLAAIENEREAITDKLAAGGQTLADLIIRPQGAPSSNFEAQDASDLGDRSSSHAGSREQPADNGGSGPKREGAPAGPAPRRDVGDVLV